MFKRFLIGDCSSVWSVRGSMSCVLCVSCCWSHGAVEPYRASQPIWIHGLTSSGVDRSRDRINCWDCPRVVSILWSLQVVTRWLYGWRKQVTCVVGSLAWSHPHPCTAHWPRVGCFCFCMEQKTVLRSCWFYFFHIKGRGECRSEHLKQARKVMSRV